MSLSGPSLNESIEELASESSDTLTPGSVEKSVYESDIASSTQPSWQIELLYDGECPLCMREVNFLKRRDADRGLVAFVNIADDDYSPAEHGGVDFETAMGRIHAVLPDGTVIKNIEVFRRVYDILGMGWVYAATRLPIVGAIVDWLYGIWADWRLALTGRPDLATIAADRQTRLCNAQGRCRLPDAQDVASTNGEDRRES
jgi:predicted DCC family thiol-disulfide oxidoreductase YuxK